MEIKVVVLDPIDRTKVKTEAKEAMNAAKPSAALITLAVVAILAVLAAVQLGVQGYLTLLKDMLADGTVGIQQVYQSFYDYIMSDDPMETREIVGTFLFWILRCMSFVIAAGYAGYALRLLRGKNPSIGDVFDAFGIVWRAILVNLGRLILLGAWTLVYLIPAMWLEESYPGVLWVQIAALVLLLPTARAAYSYSLAGYIMLDNRKLRPMQCIIMSRMVMRGRKFELFRLDLSMWWRVLLCLVPVVNLWMIPRVQLTHAAYYRKAANDFRDRQKKAGSDLAEVVKDAEEADDSDPSDDE